ncbi:ubiquinol-cytochrome-c reductase complex assembly factor 1 isoform X2 [Venturia canescens]|nr:ubiquinol-cytochrome-c reductase complex assembly factor 1 isoform X2 [Venturia canescens]
MSGNEIIPYYGATRLSALDTPSFALPPQTRFFRLAVPTYNVVSHDVEPNFFIRLLRRIPLPSISKYRRRAIGALLYEDIVHKINYMVFFSDLKMPDTFYSWFVITELHVWMLMARCMAEGQLGQELRNYIVEAMWDDVNVRKDKLGQPNTTALRNQYILLSKQFNAAIVGYDEGIMSDDKVLAGALWRRFYQCEGNDPEVIEKLVAYVRKQMNELDKTPGEDVMNMRKINWLDFRNL